MATQEKTMALAKKKTVTVTDPEKADRSLVLGGEAFELKAGTATQTFEFTSAQLGELKEKYPYLKVG